MFGVVISFYQRDRENLPLLYSLKFCLSLLKACPEISQIVVSDGSPHPNDEARKSCIEFGAAYFHGGQELSFAATYNSGAALCRTEWICLLASDIYVRSDTFSQIGKFIGNYADPAKIGAIIPYLSLSDLPGQQAASAGADCISPLMTINLNVFYKSTFEAVNGVPEGFSGCYNDVVLSHRLREAGKNIYLADAYAVHYGRLTTSAGSTVDYEADADHFVRAFPELALPGSKWSLDLTRFCNDQQFVDLFSAAMTIPDEVMRNAEIERLMANPPFLRPLDRGSF